MRDICGNLWDFLGRTPLGITTGGAVGPKGDCIMLRGCARQARDRFPSLPQKLGTLILTRGNHVFSLGDGIFSFPVENSPFEFPDLRLIERSCQELLALVAAQGWPEVVLPRPGCGTGGLEWPTVRPLLESCFDDRFLIISL
ncbi:MAG: ADP-ribose-binding protein [Syntrophotaleaceae bacterium]